MHKERITGRRHRKIKKDQQTKKGSNKKKKARQRDSCANDYRNRKKQITSNLQEPRAGECGLVAL